MTGAASGTGDQDGARDKEYAHLIRIATTVAEGIGATFGPDCEVAVHDLRDPAHSLVHLVNGHISNRQLGHPIRDLIYAVLPNIDRSEVLANYPTPLPDGRTLKSTTCLLRDCAGAPAVALCINYDVAALNVAAGALEHLTRIQGLGTGGERPAPGLGEGEVLDMLRVLIDNMSARFTRPPTKLSKEERLDAVAFLDSKGAFLIKGAVALVAETMGLSEPTIYRYLEQLRA